MQEIVNINHNYQIITQNTRISGEVGKASETPSTSHQAKKRLRREA